MNKKLLVLAVMLVAASIYAVPAAAQTGETTLVAQAKEKAKDKDIKKEKGKKGKERDRRTAGATVEEAGRFGGRTCERRSSGGGG